MAKTALPNNLIGIIMLIIGGGLAYWGFEKSEGLQSQLSTAVTGAHTDNVMLLYIGGAVCVAIGIYFMTKK